MYIYACVYVYVHVCVYIHVYMYVKSYLYIDCESQSPFFSVFGQCHRCACGMTDKCRTTTGLQWTGRRAELLGVKSGFPRSRCCAVISDVLACVHMYMLYVCVYICACMYVY